MRFKRSIRYAVFVLMISICIACAPVIKHPGQPIAPARITQTHFITSDQALLPLRSWFPEGQPTKAVVVAMHGFNDYSNFFESPAKILNQNGIACYAYDQRGFGDAPDRGFWAGIEAYSTDLSEFIQAIQKIHEHLPVFLLGESMGGAVVIATMTHPKPPAATGIILVAPAVWGRDTMPWYQSALLTLSAYTLPWMELTGEGLHIMASDNIEMLRQLGRDPKVIKATRIDAIKGLTDLMDLALVQSSRLRSKTLVLYGEQDQVIPKEPMRLMLEKMPSATQTFYYPKGYHMLLRDLHADIPLTNIVSWIDQYGKE